MAVKIKKCLLLLLLFLLLHPCICVALAGSRGQLLGDVPGRVISRGLMGCKPRVTPTHSHSGRTPVSPVCLRASVGVRFSERLFFHGAPCHNYREGNATNTRPRRALACKLGVFGGEQTGRKRDDGEESNSEWPSMSEQRHQDEPS